MVMEGVDLSTAGERQSQVGGQADAIAKSIDGLEDAVKLLAQRLLDVLRDEPICDNEKEEARPSLVPLAEGLRVSADRIRNLESAVRRIVERLEI